MRNKNMDSASVVQRGETVTFLPHELVIEILSLLPVQSLLRFKCVCKLWCAIIEDSYFIQKHLRLRPIEKAYVYFNLDAKLRERFVVHSAIDGLVLEESLSTHRYRVRNPATQQILDLPDPLGQHLGMEIFYLPIANKYKVAYLYHQNGTEFGGFKVLTLESDLRWRNLQIPSLNYRLLEKMWKNSSTGINGMFCVIRHGYSQVVCIDMESECFTIVKVPRAFLYSKEVQLLSWNGMMSLVIVGNGKLSAWVLENFNKQKRAVRQIVIPLTFTRNYLNQSIKLERVDDDWLWLFVDNEHHVSCHIKSKRINIVSAPQGQGISCCFYPSLLCLEGMKKERGGNNGMDERS